MYEAFAGTLGIMPDTVRNYWGSLSFANQHHNVAASKKYKPEPGYNLELPKLFIRHSKWATHSGGTLIGGV